MSMKNCLTCKNSSFNNNGRICVFKCENLSDWQPKEKEMRKPIFESEDEARKFLQDIWYSENDSETMIEKLKRKDYIRRNPVEEAEEMYDKFMLSYNTDGLIFNYDSIKIFNKYREAIQYQGRRIKELERQLEEKR